MFFWKVWGCNYSVSKDRKYSFYHTGPIPRLTRLTISELGKDPFMTHCIITWENLQGKVFCEYSLLYLLLLLVDEREMSDDFPQEGGSFLFQKTQNYDQSCCLNEIKIETVCFSGKFKAVTLQHSLGEDTSFAIRPQFPGLQKHVSLQFQSCVKTFLGHTVQIHEKRCQVRVFC